MSPNQKISITVDLGMRLNGWVWLGLIVILCFFWQELLLIGLILGGAWLICRHREKILQIYRDLLGK